MVFHILYYSHLALLAEQLSAFAVALNYLVQVAQTVLCVLQIHLLFFVGVLLQILLCSVRDSCFPNAVCCSNS